MHQVRYKKSASKAELLNILRLYPMTNVKYRKDEIKPIYIYNELYTKATTAIFAPGRAFGENIIKFSSLTLTNCYRDDDWCYYTLGVKRAVLWQLYRDLLGTQTDENYNLNLNELEMKQSVALVIMSAYKTKLQEAIQKIKIDTCIIDTLRKRMISVRTILSSTLPSTSTMLTWDEWIECEHSFSQRGMPGVALAVDAYRIGDKIVFLASDGNFKPRWGQAIVGKNESIAFKSTTLYQNIHNKTCGWPASFIAKNSITTCRRVNTSILIDNQMMRDLVLDDEDKQHIQGQYAWIPCSGTDDNAIGTAQNYDFDENTHDYYRQAGRFCAILNTGRFTAEGPLSQFVRTLNGANSETIDSLTFMLQFNAVVSKFDDYNLHVLPSSTPSTPMERGIKLTLSQQRSFLEEVWIYGYHVHGIALPEGQEFLYSNNYEQNDGFMAKPFEIKKELVEYVAHVQQLAFQKGASVMHVVKPPFQISDQLRNAFASARELRNTQNILSVTHLRASHNLMIKWNWDLNWADVASNLCGIDGFIHQVAEGRTGHVIFKEAEGALAAIRRCFDRY